MNRSTIARTLAGGTRLFVVAALREAAGYEFPSDPVVDLNDFNPNEDIVRFGFLPLNEKQD